MIPKIIHYCWFGGNPLPKDALVCIASWKKFLPDYEIKEWNESNFDVNCCPYVREAYQEGGLYFDTDVEIIKNMDYIVAAGNFMGFEQNLATKVSNSGVKLGVNPGLALGARKGLEFYKEILEFYETRTHFDMNEGTVVDYTTNILRKHGLQERHINQKVVEINIYTADVFCPMDSTTGLISLTKDTVSIHHYSCSWMNHKSFNFRLHLLKNRLIKIFGAKFILTAIEIVRKIRK